MFFVNIVVLFASLGGFLLGYNSSVISAALLQLENDFSLTTMWKQGLVSATVGSAAVFSLVSGLLNSFVGRRGLLLTSSFIFVCGAICCAIASNKETLLVGRLINGVGIGLVSTTSPIYISEIAPLESRGRLTTVNTLFLTGGQFVAGVFGGVFIDLPKGWRFMFAVPAFPALLQFVAFLFLPESPRWLLSQGREEEAGVALTKLHGADVAKAELESMIRDRVQAPVDTSNGLTLSKMLKSTTVRRALLVGCGLQLFQQVIGINAVMYYSASVIQLSGVSSLSSAAWLAAFVASFNFLFTLVGVYLVEKTGRRKLTLFSLFGVTVSLALLASSFQIASFTSPAVTDVADFRNGKKSTCLPVDLANSSLAASALLANACYFSNFSRSDEENDEKLHWATGSCPSAYSWMTTVGMIIYLAFFAPGMGPMPWTINAEIYPSWARSAGNGLATCTNWVFNLIISTTFLTLIEVLTPYGAFWLYCGLSALGFLFVAFTLPETRKKSLEDIENLFEKT